jgi:hypothetical protein
MLHYAVSSPGLPLLEGDMDVGDSVRKAIDDWEDDEVEAAMLHACNAVDGTAARWEPDNKGSNRRFTELLRRNYFILGPMGAPGVDLVETRFPVRVERPKAGGGLPDFADVIYGIHRCHHGHGKALPDGFELLHDAADTPRLTRMEVQEGKVRFSDRVIFGLLAVVVFSPVNADQTVPAGYHLTFGDRVLPIDEWWGRASDFAAVVAMDPTPLVKMDFGEWMDAAT